MSLPLAMTPNEVAEALGLTLSAFRRARPELARARFPRPLPGLAARWSRNQVAAWIDAGGHLGAPAAPKPQTALDAARAALESRYAGRAA